MTDKTWIWIIAIIAAAVGAVLLVILVRWALFNIRRRIARANSLLDPHLTVDPEIGRPCAWIIDNPSKHDNPETFRQLLADIAKENGITDLNWIETTREDPGTGQALEAVENGATLVIAAGGDGTVRAVAAGLAHSGVRMGILPVGTGNLLARNLGLPIDNVAAALNVAFGEQHRHVDIAWMRAEDMHGPRLLQPEGAVVTGSASARKRFAMSGVRAPLPDEYAYVVLSGLGFDGEAIARTDPDMKKQVGWVAYVLSGLRTLGARRMRCHVTLHPRLCESGSYTDGIRTTEVIDEMANVTARSIMFANCSHLPLVVLAPDAVIDDGKLDIVAVDTRAGLIGWMNVAGKIVFQGAGIRPRQQGVSTSHIAFRQAAAATARVDHPEVVEVDGDVIGSARVVHARCDAAALDIAVPNYEGPDTKAFRAFQERNA